MSSDPMQRMGSGPAGKLPAKEAFLPDCIEKFVPAFCARQEPISTPPRGGRRIRGRVPMEWAAYGGQGAPPLFPSRGGFTTMREQSSTHILPSVGASWQYQIHTS